MRILVLDRLVDRAVSPFSDRTIRVGASGLIAFVGVVLVAVLVSRALSGYSNALGLLFGGVFPVLLAAGVVAGGLFLARSSLDGRGSASVWLWWAIGSVVAATTGVAIVVFENANGVTVTEPAVILAGNTATGGLGGLIVGYFAARRLAVAREVATERERLADEREKLALVNRIVRHDIGNDLQVISASSEHLDSHVDASGQEVLDRLQRTATEAVDLTEQVRTFVQALDEDTVERRPISLRRVLDTQIGTARERHPEVTIHADEIPHVEVVADELLASVVHNLLSNAIAHNDTADPLVELSVERREETVLLRVADNGPGIPDERKERLFDRGEKHAGSSGTGIGLHIVGMLVERYGGDISIEDNDPRGAVFVVELPRAERSETGSERAIAGSATQC